MEDGLGEAGDSNLFQSGGKDFRPAANPRKTSYAAGKYLVRPTAAFWQQLLRDCSRRA
jgi:hypothetical protein